MFDTSQTLQCIFRLTQVVILEHAAKRRKTQGDLELQSIRLVLTNSIVNPWLYIVLRKENLHRILSAINWIRQKFTQSEDFDGNYARECEPILRT